MAGSSNIEWTDATWIVGCSIKSPGCKNCYAQRTAAPPDRVFTFRMKGKSAGRLLDGKEHSEFPQAKEVAFA